MMALYSIGVVTSNVPNLPGYKSWSVNCFHKNSQYKRWKQLVKFSRLLVSAFSTTVANLTNILRL